MQRTQGSRGERSRGGHRRARDGGSGHGAPDLAGEGAEARRVGAAVALLVAGEADGSGRESAAANEREAEEAGLATNEVRRRSAGGEAGSIYVDDHGCSCGLPGEDREQVREGTRGNGEEGKGMALICWSPVAAPVAG